MEHFKLYCKARALVIMFVFVLVLAASLGSGVDGAAGRGPEAKVADSPRGKGKNNVDFLSELLTEKCFILDSIFNPDFKNSTDCRQERLYNFVPSADNFFFTIFCVLYAWKSLIMPFGGLILRSM